MASASSKLAELIESGQFDWDNLDHRRAYLRAWVKGEAPPPPQRRGEGAGDD